jgi:hypothetical protein
MTELFALEDPVLEGQVHAVNPANKDLSFEYLSST